LIPRDPEALDDPKRTLVNLARRSRRRGLRDAITPAPGVSAVVGPGYTSVVEEFIVRGWDIAAAITRSPSLRRCVIRLGELK